jgi:hypothetical protein
MAAQHVTPVCFGVCCDKHASCVRYAAVDFADAYTLRIATCGERHTMYVPIDIQPRAGDRRRIEIAAKAA